MVKVSDLFSGPYDHSRRMNEQAILIERLKNIPEAEEEVKFLQDFQDSRIASIIVYETIIDNLKAKNIPLS